MQFIHSPGFRRLARTWAPRFLVALFVFGFFVVFNPFWETASVAFGQGQAASSGTQETLLGWFVTRSNRPCGSASRDSTYPPRQPLSRVDRGGLLRDR